MCSCFFVLAILWLPWNNSSFKSKGSIHITQSFGFLGWHEIADESFPINYTQKSINVIPFFNTVQLRFVQKTISYGDIEFIRLKVCGKNVEANYARYVETSESVVEDLAKDDHNVVVNHEKPIEVSWTIPDECNESPILTIKANEYESPEQYAFRFPNWGIESETYAFQNNGSFVVDGKLDEVDGTVEPQFSPFWVAATGHPSNSTHLYLVDDDTYVYIAADVLLDNTNEFGQDWIKVFVKNSKLGTETEYRIDDEHVAYGRCRFGLTTKVSHKHQSCEIRIPKKEIQGNHLDFLLRYYGTSGGSGSSPTLLSSSYENPTYDSTPTLTGVAQDDDADITSIVFNIQRFNGSWSNVFSNTSCSIDDGALDETTEGFTCNVPGGTQLTIDGSYRYNISITDGGSNSPNFLKTFTFSIDTEAPTITYDELSPDPTTDTTPTFNGTADEGVGTVSNVEYQIDSVDGSWTSCTADDGTFDESSEAFTCTVSPALTSGDHTMYIRTTDSNNNTSADEDYSDTFTVTIQPTATPTPRASSSHSSSSNSAAFQPQIPQETIRDIGGIFTPIIDSYTDGQNILVIIPPQTFSFDAYLHSSVVTPLYRGSLANPITGAFSAMLPKNILFAGNILGIRTSKGTLWQIGKIQNIWYKAYAPNGSTTTAAKIIPELQNKSSIIAFSYTDKDLIPPGKPKSPFNPKRLKLAHSLDGVIWKILPTSVVDTKNHTVAALHKIGGYYMVVGY